MGGGLLSRLSGLTAIFSKHGGLTVKQGQQEKASRLFIKGFVVEFANPKALLYFAAILPQFLNVKGSLPAQFLIMGLTTLALDVIAYSVYAFLGSRISKSGVKGWIIKVLIRQQAVHYCSPHLRWCGFPTNLRATFILWLLQQAYPISPGSWNIAAKNYRSEYFAR